jgi:hypothetical protein
MSARKSILAIAFAVTALPAAFAGNFVGGEMGYESHPANSSLIRQEVIAEYLAFRQHPVQADGTVMLQGELGQVSALEGAFADCSPAAPHTHAMGNAGAAIASSAGCNSSLRS